MDLISSFQQFIDDGEQIEDTMLSDPGSDVDVDYTDNGRSCGTESDQDIEIGNGNGSQEPSWFSRDLSPLSVPPRTQKKRPGPKPRRKQEPEVATDSSSDDDDPRTCGMLSSPFVVILICNVYRVPYRIQNISGNKTSQR